MHLQNTSSIFEAAVLIQDKTQGKPSAVGAQWIPSAKGEWSSMEACQAASQGPKHQLLPLTWMESK